MSTIIATTLGNGVKSVPVDTVAEGAAKAWANLNGSGTVAVRDSFNVSSFTDNGTGDYTENFTAALANANYANNCTAGQGDATASIFTFPRVPAEAAQTTNACRFRLFNNSGAATDRPDINLSLSGDAA